MIDGGDLKQPLAHESVNSARAHARSELGGEDEDVADDGERDSARPHGPGAVVMGQRSD